jgi:4-carboxymuconolactone decarboxylase
MTGTDASVRRNDPMPVDSMTDRAAPSVTLDTFDAETAALVQLAALLAGGSEAQVRESLARAVSEVRAEWVDEVILQTYLFAGFPRALNAAREWRRVSGRPAPEQDDAAIDAPAERKERGEDTCRRVYGHFYERLRVNIAELHPALDRWMIEEGYGKVLSRAPLDLARRELCIVAACAIARQDRQLHSHLHGALHAGATPAVVTAALATVTPWIDANDGKRYQGLWARVQGK